MITMELNVYGCLLNSLIRIISVMSTCCHCRCFGSLLLYDDSWHVRLEGQKSSARYVSWPNQYSSSNQPRRAASESLFTFLIFYVSITMLSSTRNLNVDASIRSVYTLPSYRDQILDQIRIRKLRRGGTHQQLQTKDLLLASETVSPNLQSLQLRRQQTMYDMNYSSSCEDLCKQCITVPTYFHVFTLPRGDGDYVIPHPSSAVNNSKSSEESFTSLQELNAMISDQMIVLNNAYKKTPFKFKHMNPTNPSFSFNFQYTNYAYDYYHEMSMKHGVGYLDTLNVFLSYSVSSRNGTSTETDNPTSGDLVAFASFPSHQLRTETIGGDGVFMRFDCLFDGGSVGTDRGYTLVHEVGHWLGLYHIFQRGINHDPKEFGEYDACSPNDENDFVDDTPVSAGPAQDLFPDCTKYLPNTVPTKTTSTNSTINKIRNPDSCPNLPGDDPIFNFMNYVSTEECFENGVGYFTCGQIERMYHQWLLYRQQITGSCIEKSKNFELEIFVKFDRDWYYFEGSFFLLDATTGTVLFNSTRDQDSIGVLLYQDSMLIDLCVPNGSYNLTINDKAGDGFTRGSGSFIKVFVNKVEVESVSDDFGKSSTLMISYDNGYTTKQLDSTKDHPSEGGSSILHSSSTILSMAGTVFYFFFLTVVGLST